MHFDLVTGVACVVGMLAVSCGMDAVRDFRKWRRARRSPGTRGQLRLLDEEGKPILHASLPAAGLENLLSEYLEGKLD